MMVSILALNTNRYTLSWHGKGHADNEAREGSKTETGRCGATNHVVRYAANVPITGFGIRGHR